MSTLVLFYFHSMAQKAGTYTFSEFQREMLILIDKHHSMLQTKYQAVERMYEVSQMRSHAVRNFINAPKISLFAHHSYVHPINHD